MKKQKQVKSYVEIFQGQRKSWGSVNPVTKVIPDKRFKKPKYKGRDWEWFVLTVKSVIWKCTSSMIHITEKNLFNFKTFGAHCVGTIVNIKYIILKRVEV